ncbi:SDR family oxidoreductase [candidate division KSB1 bacterium]|nr:SDR family oxidoreductase [candidate division KSB1 bacterium]
MKVLFIGGTGIISSACSKLCIEKGMELYLLNRGQTNYAIPPEAKLIQADIRDQQTIRKILKNDTFDVVVDWVAYTVDHIETDLNLFLNRTHQYIFISSASAYHKPILNLPITESTPLHNPYWQYSRNKIACEERLLKAYREQNFPITIVRPSHTYNETKLPIHGGYAAIARMRQGKKVIVHGDGTSLWVLTHHSDFAVGLVGLLGNQHTIGETFHITSDEVLTWNQIYDILAQKAGCTAEKIYLPSTVIAQYDAEWGAGLLGDKANSVIFDNTKIKRFIPEFNSKISFSQGAEEIIKWFDSNPSQQVVQPEFDQQMDRLVKLAESLFKE